MNLKKSRVEGKKRKVVLRRRLRVPPCFPLMTPLQLISKEELIKGYYITPKYTLFRTLLFVETKQPKGNLLPHLILV